MPFLPPDYEKAVVLIGIGIERGNCKVDLTPPIVTGFLVAVTSANSGKKHSLLVTVHYDAVENASEDLCYWYHTKSGSIKAIPFSSVVDEFGSNWKYIPKDFDDVAIIPAPFKRGEDAIKAIPMEGFLPMKRVRLGMDVFFLGYPFGTVKTDNITPFVRKGTISKKDDGDNKIIIDGYSVGGSSGSPVFLKPHFGNKEYNLDPIAPHFVGMIQGHLNRENTDINLNLAYALSADKIEEFIISARNEFFPD
ncbi:MAG: hypothetical protein ACFFD4_35260 [Candidatus Odinarchaeota archaeon]